MISYGAERNICFRICKSKSKKALNLVIIHNNHKSPGEEEFLLLESRVPPYHRLPLKPWDAQGWSVLPEMLGHPFMCLEENGLDFQSDWLKVSQVEPSVRGFYF